MFLYEDYVELLDVIEGASIPLMTKPYSSPFEITAPEFRIVIEEAAAFFEGNQTSRETVARIQSRVGTYPSEQLG